MRLHLVIERHGLPVTRVLWTTQAPGSYLPSLTQAASSYSAPSSSTLTSSRNANRALGANGSIRASGSGGLTIAQLLEDVHNVIPLQSDDSELGGQSDDYTGQFWTLEDYVVEVGGSECLHFMEVDGILREEDEVIIRPLQPEELHARKATGRMQISADGWHLIDGVPFGHRFTQGKRSSRPPVRIPFRKKRRLMYEGLDELNNEEEGEYGEQEDLEHDQQRLRYLREYMDELSSQGEEEEEYEEDYETGEEDHEEQEDEEGANDIEMHSTDTETEAQRVDETRGGLEEGSPEAPHSRQHRVPKTQSSRPSVRKNILQELDLAESESSSRASGVISTSRDTTKNTSMEPAIRSKPTYPLSSDEEVLGSSSSSETANSSSRSPSTDETSSGADDYGFDRASYSPPVTRSQTSTAITEGHAGSQKHTPPGSGSKATKYGNTRSKMRRKLNRLKAAGLLGESANFEDLRRWEQENPEGHPQLAAAAAAAARSEKNTAPSGQVQVQEQEQEQGQEEQQSVQEPSKMADEQAEFEAKRARLLEAIQAGGVDVSKSDMSPSGSISGRSQSQTSSEASSDKEVAPEEEPIVFKKKNRAFMPAPRAVQLGKGSKAPVKPVQTTNVTQEAAAPENSETVDAWQEKLTLGATECVYDHIDITAPPFPFKQRWDKDAGYAIFAAIQEEDESNKVGKRKRVEELEAPSRTDRSGAVGEPEDTQLDYGDDIATKEVDSPDGKEEALPEPTGGDDTVPPLPPNLLTLPPLLRSYAKPNAVIVFKRMGLMPDAVGVSCRYYTARILRATDTADGDIQLTMRLAKRDQIQLQKEKQRSVWNKFSGPTSGPDEDEVRTGIYKANFSFLVQAKLLAPA
ncbi:hypothetical protein KEM54_001757 [Ascosphaera aggregata]|nr:hypothetical protein KEM54_001757 [Ascosphaera aggregata]